MPRILVVSIQTGQAQQYAAAPGLEVLTACGKQPVFEPVMVTPAGVSGDMQVEHPGHGGPDRAVLVYARHHYLEWERELGHAWPPGSFGENLTVEGQDEGEACVGDIYTLGGCRLEASYPRQPCSKLARYLQQLDIEQRIRANFRSGWFLRVLEAGKIEAGQELRLEARPQPEWTMRRVSQVMYHEPENREAARELAGLNALAWAWRKKFVARAAAE